MNYTEFIEEMYPSMAGLGYKKGNETNWTLRMPEIMVISYVVFNSDGSRFDIELGILFNQLYDDRSWKKCRRGHEHIKTTLYTLLQTMGEPQQELDEVFSYSSNIQLRTAQDLLAVTREALGKPKKSYVSVKEFCFINHLPEDEVREALRKTKPDFSIK
jgi:hypothetical protein